jgi:two-component system cell cycle sensor histidine kinase/response regulator CckA
MLDITDRRRAEEKLRESEHFLRSILESTPNLVYIYDLDEHRNLYANQEVAHFLGYSSDQIAAMGSSLFARILHPEDAAAVGEHHARLSTGRHPLARVEYRMRHAGGEWRWLRSHDVPFARNADGTVRSILGSTEDVTEEKRALMTLQESEQKLRQSEARYRSLVEGSIEGIGIARGNRVVYANRALLDIFGYDSMEEWTEVPLLELVAPASRALVRDRLERRARGESLPPRYEYQIVRRDGAIRDLEISTAEIDFDGELHVQSTFRDVTERKRSEAERARLEEQFRQAQKMESVGRLAGGVAHDFNNMLGVILGQTELALDRVDQAHPLYAELRIIREAAERSADLTRRLLAFARKQTVAPKVLDLNETLSGMLTIVRRLIGEDIHLVWLPGPTPGSVKIDPSQLDQMLANLCVNARDAIAGTGRLTIETGCTSFDEEYCTVHPGVVPGDYVHLSVSDDGCGMDRETMSHLFEPFFTTKEPGKGTGLGLATVFGIVRQNNGIIDVQSAPGQGTTFKIHLPRHQSEIVSPAPGGAPSAASGKETILLVEDEAGMRKVTVRMLQRLGYTVIEASSPAEAIHMARVATGRIDLLLTDVVMPEMNGRDLAKNLVSSHPDIKHLFMSGYTADVIANHGVLDEGVHFLEKPFSKDLLAAKIREALGQQ